MTCRSDLDVYSALLAWGWVLFQWRSWRRLGGFREGRSFVMSIFEHWKTGDGFFLLCLLKMYSHVKWKWMCDKKNSLFCQRQWKICYFTSHFLICLFPWGARNCESPWCLDKTSPVVWCGWQSLASLLPKLLDQFTVYLIQINCIILLSKSPKNHVGSVSPKHFF